MTATPYKVVEKTDKYTVYEYNTLYLWLLYAILTTLCVGVFLGIKLLSAVGGVLTVLYFFCVSIPYRRLGRVQRKAMTTGAVEFTGNKWSFSNPLRVKIPKTSNT